MLHCLRRTGNLPSFFVPTPGDLTVQESPPPGICHPGPKNANARGSAGGALGAAGIDWCITAQTSRFSFSYSISYDKNFTPKHLDNTLTYTFCLNFTNIEAADRGKISRKRFWKNSFQCREILLQVKWVMASFCCYENCDVIATLIITKFHLYLIQLWC